MLFYYVPLKNLIFSEKEVFDEKQNLMFNDEYFNFWGFQFSHV